MLDARFESGVRLPEIPQDMIPTVEARTVREWERIGHDRRRIAAGEITAAFAVDPASAARLPWWPVVANLSVGPFEEEQED